MYRKLARKIRARYVGGVLKPLEKLELTDGEEVIISIERSSKRLTNKYWSILKKRRPDITREEFLRVLEEIENGDIRRY